MTRQIYADYDDDGDLDIYLANNGPNRLYRNDGTGRFEDVTAGSGLDVPMYGLGPAVGDVDRDGWIDIYVPDMGYGCLLMNRQDYFEDKTAPTGPVRLPE